MFHLRNSTNTMCIMKEIQRPVYPQRFHPHLLKLRAIHLPCLYYTYGIHANRMCNLFLPPATAALTRAQLPYLPRTGDLLRLLRVGANKAMSQNFILDMNVNRRVRPACVYVRTCAQIVRIMPAPVKDAHICEVGPGPGGITRALLENDCLSLTGIEIDRRFFPMLEVCACRCASAQFTSCYVTQPAIGLILCTAMC
jgi:hypothetical protein